MGLPITTATIEDAILQTDASRLGYEDKDLGAEGAPFYLACGIADVLVVDPRSKRVLHYRQGQPVAQHITPITIDLACGCRVIL